MCEKERDRDQRAVEGHADREREQEGNPMSSGRGPNSPLNQLQHMTSSRLPGQQTPSWLIEKVNQLSFSFSLCLSVFFVLLSLYCITSTFLGVYSSLSNRKYAIQSYACSRDGSSSYNNTLATLAAELEGVWKR